MQLGVRYNDTNITHSVYARYITGSAGDFFVVTPTLGRATLFDGLVKPEGEIVKRGLQIPGTVAEVKTGFQLNLSAKQILREDAVAETCGLNYFLSFTNENAANRARVCFPPYLFTTYPFQELFLFKILFN